MSKNTMLGVMVVLAGAGSTAQAQQAAPQIAAGVSMSSLFVKGPPSAPLSSQPPKIVVPDSSIEKPEDFGRRVHTHYNIVVPPASAAVTPQAVSPAAGSPPYTGYFYETPPSLGCIYRLTTGGSGCDPNIVTAVPTGGSKAIAIVDAYDLPTAKADLLTFSKQFGLPVANFSVIYAAGTKPGYNSGWALEEALDIEMAHAMAPSAKLYLVEAASSSNVDLEVAVDKAYTLVKAAGGGQVSMSYGGAEFSDEASHETHYNKVGNVVFFASTGDAPGVEYPSASPNVVAVGGTNTAREWYYYPNRGKFLEETAWAATGGGLSQVFKRPSFQTVLGNRYGIDARAVPDVAAVASDLTAVWVYVGGTAAQGGGWTIVNGTSVASPLVAGMANKWGTFRASSAAQLTYMYSKIATTAFFDVRSGSCGPYSGYLASTAFSTTKNMAHDLCTGLGTPQGLSAF